MIVKKGLSANSIRHVRFLLFFLGETTSNSLPDCLSIIKTVAHIAEIIRPTRSKVGTDYFLSSLKNLQHKPIKAMVKPPKLNSVCTTSNIDNPASDVQFLKQYFSKIELVRTLDKSLRICRYLMSKFTCHQVQVSLSLRK